jgi:hypothetical protein
MSCRIDSPGAGVLVDAPRCRFISFVIDHPTGDAEVLEFTERAVGCAWSGPVDGRIKNALADRPESPKIEP